jgi:hypothetical protein
LIELTVFDVPQAVSIDWDYALKACKSLDKSLGGGNTIRGKTAIVILAEYAATAYRCASPPDGVGLIVVVCPPGVWFCPNNKGADGLFIEPYSLEKHGEEFQIVGKTQLLDFCSISARMDGWGFFSEMIDAAKSRLTIAQGAQKNGY